MTTSDITGDENQPLKELVNLADESFWIFRNEARDPRSIDFPSLAFYRHLIHMAHGIDILLSATAARTAIPLLRSAFEAHLYLAYLFQERFVQRSLAWLCSYYRRLQRGPDLLNPTTKNGSKLQIELERIFPEKSFKHLFGADAVSLNPTWITEKLHSPPLDGINREYDELMKKGRDPEWYSLDDPDEARKGLKLKGLSDRVDMAGPYLIYYGRWSEVIHANEFESFLLTLPNGTVDFEPLRGSAGVKDPTIELGARFFIEQSTPLMAKRFAPA